jgi:predicted nucleic acid-binding protein
VAFCDAGRLECLTKPFALGNVTDIVTYQSFFNSPQVKMLPVTATIWERAAEIGAKFRLKPLDSVHLAAAIEHNCSTFLTNDIQLARCPEILVEILS